MHIVADQHIPFIADIFSGLGDLHLIPGHMINAASLSRADVLVVRSITPINASLLGSSRLSFVGSATAGVDHVDYGYLQSRGIGFGHAPGANAESVVEYVLASLAELSETKQESFLDRSIGIVGAGNVGGLLARRCAALGMNVFINDPLLESQYPSEFDFVGLRTLLQEADIVSIHTPLTESGPHPSVGLIGPAQLRLLKQGAWFIHTARGGVCDEASLILARTEGGLGALVLDVWENEPVPQAQHIAAADIATGHIAGYSIDAKIRGVQMIRDHIARHFSLNDDWQKNAQNPINELLTECFSTTLTGRILEMYPIRPDDIRFRTQMSDTQNVGRSFHAYRAEYPLRRSFSAFPPVSNTPRVWVEALNLAFEPEGA